MLVGWYVSSGQLIPTINLPNYQDFSVQWPSSTPPLRWEDDQQGTGSRKGNQQRVPNPEQINFEVSYMTELSLTIFYFNNTGVRTEDNAVIHEKTHAVLFASNEYNKSIF